VKASVVDWSSDATLSIQTTVLIAESYRRHRIGRHTGRWRALSSR
jgi:hypothetical protein